MSFKIFVHSNTFQPTEFNHSSIGHLFSDSYDDQYDIQLSNIVKKWKAYNASGDIRGLPIDTDWIVQLFTSESSTDEFKKCSYSDVRFVINNYEQLFMKLAMRLKPENSFLNNIIGRGGFLWNLGKKGLEAINVIDDDQTTAKKQWKNIGETVANTFRAVLHCENTNEFTYLELYKMSKFSDLKSLLTIVWGSPYSSTPLFNGMVEDVLFSIVSKEYNGSAVYGSQKYYDLFDKTRKMVAQIKDDENSELISGPEGVRKWNRLQEKYLEKELETRNEKSEAEIKKAKEKEETANDELTNVNNDLSKKKRELESLQEEYRNSDGILSHIADRAGKEIYRMGFNKYKPSKMPKVSKGMADEMEIRRLKVVNALLASLPKEIEELEKRIPDLEERHRLEQKEVNDLRSEQNSILPSRLRE
jgi:hypothetical protein